MAQYALRFGGEQFLLQPGRYRIGRARDCDLWIKDRMVSRCHVILNVQESSVELEDNGSKNGVWINGRRSVRAALRDGDLLTIGSHELRFSEVTALRRRTTTGPILMGGKVMKRPRRPATTGAREITGRVGTAHHEAECRQAEQALGRKDYQEAEAALFRCLGWIDRATNSDSSSYGPTVVELASAALTLGLDTQKWEALMSSFELMAKLCQPPTVKLLRAVDASLGEMPREAKRAVAACLTFISTTAPDLGEELEEMRRVTEQIRAGDGMHLAGSK